MTTTTTSTELSALFELEPAKRIQLAQDLWDSVAEDDVTIPDAHFDELERRRENLRQNPDLGVTWEQAKQRVLGADA